MQERLSPEDLNKFIAEEENQLTKRVNVGNHSIQVSYRPTDLWIYREVGGLTIDSVTYDSLYNRYANYCYFALSLSLENEEVPDHAAAGLYQYGELVQTLSFRMDKYVTLITSTHDTIPADDVMLNRTVGLGNTTDLLFAFDKEKITGKETVCFNLNEFGLGIGNQQFQFRTRDMEEAPKIKFQIVSYVTTKSQVPGC